VAPAERPSKTPNQTSSLSKVCRKKGVKTPSPNTNIDIQKEHCTFIKFFLQKSRKEEVMLKTKRKQTQISAYISESIKEDLHQLSQKRGLKKAYLVEQALEYHLRALQELPEEAFLPSHVVLSESSFLEVLQTLENPPEPTEALRKLANAHSFAQKK
jgi:uncharacterized protein (DUF1778 family)